MLCDQCGAEAQGLRLLRRCDQCGREDTLPHHVVIGGCHHGSHHHMCCPRGCAR